jgi:hypothetical protein
MAKRYKKSARQIAKEAGVDIKMIEDYNPNYYKLKRVGEQ